MTDQEFYTVPKLAKQLGITPRAIRFYETKGLLVPQRAGSTRVYTNRDRARLILILRGKRLGFSLAEISEFLDLYNIDTNNKQQTVLLSDKVRNKITELEEQRSEIDLVLTELIDIEEKCIEALSD
ncbi:MerR family DNA-binding transcriptional regulator [Gammaproteobacteria bacterium AS21]